MLPNSGNESTGQGKLQAEEYKGAVVGRALGAVDEMGEGYGVAGVGWPARVQGARMNWVGALCRASGSGRGADDGVCVRVGAI